MKTSFIGIATVLALGLTAVPALAQNEVGSTQQCVRLSDIDQSPVIDDETVLLKMRQKDAFKRIDMRGTCSGLKFSGFGHTTPTNELCTSSPVKVLRPMGADCMIEKIVTIDKAEADALMATR